MSDDANTNPAGSQLEPLTRMPPMPMAARLTAGVFSGLAAASSAWLLIGAIGRGAEGAMPAAFWGVSILAGVFGILLGAGRFAAGPAMAAFCVGSTLFFAAGSGRLAELANIRSVVFDPFFLAHTAAGFIVTAAGGIAVLVRRPASFRKLFIGGALTGFGLGAVGMVYLAWGSLTTLTGAAGVAAAVGGVILSLIVLVTLCSGGHYLIKAFEMGAIEPEDAGV